RMDPYVHADGANSVKRNLQKHEIECLIVIGGDGSLRAASRLQADGLSIVGIPKTIDNDVGGTEVSIGFHTAVQIVVDAIDRLTTTAEAHNRIMVIEVMGRTAGWIAGVAGLAGGAEAILVPESAIDYPDLAVRLTKRHDSGHDYSIVVVAEGIPDPTGRQTGHEVDQFGFERLGGVANGVAAELERLTAYEARVMSLGYLQRGGSPTAFDRVLGSRFGIRAAELAMEGVSGVMVALQCDSIVEVDLDESCRLVRELDPRRLEEASWFFA
ncbi:MAG: ATP-dependent 6-phosphofructokinase, partial [Acidimicrobiia bacterium]